MRTCFQRVCEQHSWNGAIDLTKERGVYNLYVQVAGGDGNVERAVDVSPNEMEVDESGHRASGGLRSGEEVIAPRVPPVPAKPTQAEQDEHHATGHAAYRSWREHCVKGRGRASPHAVVSEGELPEVGVDYAYLGPEGTQVTILVCKCKRTGCLAATQVPEKGMNVYALAFFTGWLRGLGGKRLLLRSDNERTLLAFLRAAAASLEGVEVIEQASPEGDHAANGLAEVGVREVKAQTRVLKSHLEERLKRQLDWSEPLATWLVPHSANCLSRYRIQNDGKTPDQRRTGKRWRRQVVELGEKAALPPVAARREGRVAGDAERMMDGIFVGHHERTGASLFLSERGLLREVREFSGKLQTNSGTMNSSENVEEFRGCSSEKSLR